jgi:hypothetical protein
VRQVSADEGPAEIANVPRVAAGAGDIHQAVTGFLFLDWHTTMVAPIREHSHRRRYSRDGGIFVIETVMVVMR